MQEYKYTMADFEIQRNSGNIYKIQINGKFAESDTDILAERLTDMYQSNEVSYLCIDLSDYHVLPLRALGSSFLRFYRDEVSHEPVFIALIVQASLASVLSSVVKTLMRREWVQIFTKPERAYQWLELEQQKQLAARKQ